MRRKGKRALLAASAAVAFCAGCGSEATDDSKLAKVQCEGANGCKGQGECATAHHECGGLNSCKGKGWIALSADECREAGGAAKPT